MTAPAGGEPNTKPYAATIDIATPEGNVMATVESGNDGTSLRLAAGSYRLVPRSPQGRPLPYAAPLDATIAAGQTTIAHLDGTLPSSDICVYDLVMSGFKSGRSYGVKATVTADDASWLPGLGAIVTGSFSGATSSTVSGVTDASGKVTLTSTSRSGGGTWTFTVTSISKTGWSYNASLNRKTSATLKYP